MSNALTTKAFWADTFERTVRTGAQAAITLGIGNVTNLISFDWVGFLTGVLVSMAVAVLTAIVASGNLTGTLSPASFLPAADGTPSATSLKAVPGSDSSTPPQA